jgi:hypothetical protein
MDGTSEILTPRLKTWLRGVDKMTRIKDHRIVIELSEADFEESMGRKPRDQDEFDEWAMLAEKGLLNGHIDWDIIYECTHDAMEDRGEGK